MKVIKHDNQYTITDITDEEMRRLVYATSGSEQNKMKTINKTLKNPQESNCLYRSMGFR